MSLLSVALPDRFISITGQDAIKFLQGQTSCDLNTLTTDQFSYGTLNTPKGRMYCLFKIIKTNTGVLLSMEESLLDTTLQTLNKYAVFFKCTLQEESAYQAFGFIGTSLDTPAFTCVNSHDAVICLTLSAKKQLIEVWKKEATALPEKLHGARSTDLAHWLALETTVGIPALYAESQDEFILQTLNLHHLNAVSFKKGCYTGQEIIARMKFLGKQKKQTFLLHCDAHISQAPLSTVYSKEGKKLGTLVRAHYSEESGTYALAVLPIESNLNDAQVFLNEGLETPFSVNKIDYSEFTK